MSMDNTHAFDQPEAFTRELSPLLWTYYSRLKKEGFTDEQAFELARDFQKITAKGGEK